MQHRISFSTNLKIALVAGKKEYKKLATVRNFINKDTAEIFSNQPLKVNAGGRLLCENQLAEVY